MHESFFIVLAYAATGTLIAALCIATALRARRAAQRLSRLGQHET
jgi:heme exporter protein CcmD